MSAAAERAKKYLFAIATVYMCYLTHGVQAIIFSQNQVNFYTQWGFTDAAAGAAAVSLAITWTGVGKFVSVWIGGEISDRIGRKIPAVLGGVLYIISFVIMLVTDNATVACVAGFLSGVATSGFWDGALYPAIAEANPRYSASTTIGIKAVISVSGIIYPIFAAMNSGDSWHINIWIPIVMSIIATVFAILTPFVYDDERKQAVESGDGSAAKNAADAEIQAAKDAMLQQPTAMTNFVTLFFGFVIMFIMYGAQQYSKSFGINNLGLDPVAAAGMTSIYTAGSIIAVLFWAWMMGKLRWTPIKVILIDAILSAAALALVILALPLGLGAGVVYVAIAVLGFGAAGGMLQTGVTLRQMMCPGPRGRNVGMYYTFMGFASVFLPFIVGSMTSATGEATAVWIMMILLLVASVLAILMSLYIIGQHKKQFGESAMKPMKD
ncbi:MFS transporter [uncultured Slackia sp.]|uniref:MFS transporter n=1 Tax=uncultured Slackia sp. TaxID=665903 RepID=UPI0025CC4997|nr:MFS transporter [uncultured Slackia sp.]